MPKFTQVALYCAKCERLHDVIIAEQTEEGFIIPDEQTICKPCDEVVNVVTPERCHNPIIATKICEHLAEKCKVNLDWQKLLAGMVEAVAVIRTIRMVPEMVAPALGRVLIAFAQDQFGDPDAVVAREQVDIEKFEQEHGATDEAQGWKDDDGNDVG